MFLLEQQRRKHWYQRRRWTVTGGVLATLVAFFFGDLRNATTRAYRTYRQRRALQQAQAFAASRDRANAILALDVALQSNPENAETWQTAAEILDRAGDQRALELRRQIFRSNPNSRDALLALASTALRFNDPLQAESALAVVPPGQANDPAVLKLRAALSVAKGQPHSARRTLAALAELEPENPTMRFNLAALELRHGDAAEQAHAREELAHWAKSAQPSVQLAALRELTRDAAQRGDMSLAAARTRELLDLPGATFADELLRLDLLWASRAPQTDAVYQAAAIRAGKTPETAGMFITWLLVRGRAAEALAWAQSLPAQIRTTPTVAAIAADCLGGSGQWDALSHALTDGAWGPVRAAAVEAAFSAHTAGRARSADISPTWTKALELAGTDLSTMRVLLRLADLWAWPEQAEQTLLVLVQRRPDQTWAFRALVSRAYARGDATCLKNVYDAWHRAWPEDARVSGDWAMLTLLLEPTTQPSEAKSTAKRLHLADPKDPFFATTHAFACYQSGQIKDAIGTMAQLKAEDLDVPGRALYNGLFLAADGHTESARKALDQATHARLLPAELALLREARSYVDGTSPARPRR